MVNQKLQKHNSELQHRLNKIIEENVQLRLSLQRLTPPNATTPTSPLPPISELHAGKEVEEEDELMEQEEMERGEELGPKEVYAIVDRSKVNCMTLYIVLYKINSRLLQLFSDCHYY